MIFQTTYKKDNFSLLAQLKEANKYLPWINEAARKYSLQPCIIAGLGSRESAWGLDLKPEGPEGTGDFVKRRPRRQRQRPLPPDGLGFGRGLMQIDYDWHVFARTGKWQDPGENILYGCGLLAYYRNRIHRELGEIGKQLDNLLFLRCYLAAYNAGNWGRIINLALNNNNPDKVTSGENYSSDVLNRAGWFQSQGWTGEVLMADILKDKQSSFNISVSC